MNRKSGILWFLQRVTGFLIVIFLGFHIWIMHYAKGQIELDFNRISARLSYPFWKIYSIIFLTLILFHGLNGVRGVIFDLRIRKQYQTILYLLILVIGIILFIFGLKTIHLWKIQ